MADSKMFASSTSPRNRPYRLFEVTGIELEYPVVDRNLDCRCLVEPLFRRIAGRPTSDAEYRDTIFSNELAAHVFEIKTREPERSLAAAEQKLVEGVSYVVQVLRDEFGARLLPTGMHPFFDPSKGRLWPRAGRHIYRTYGRLFRVRDHGWLNVQSCHVNLPFGSEAETVLLHNAIACLMPYLPALTASSPVYAGKPGPNIDNRLAFYRGNQRRIPSIAGQVVPEYMSSYKQYRSEILRRIYRDLDKVAGAERLKHEWVNSRGAILRFYRNAIEIRTLDTQECVKMDIAVACFVKAALRVLVSRLREGSMTLPEHGMLVADFDAVTARGSRAPVAAKHLRAGGRASTSPIRVLDGLLESCEARTPAAERPYLTLVEARLREGNLSERILARLNKSTGRGDSRLADTIRGVYGELADCLEANRPW